LVLSPHMTMLKCLVVFVMLTLSQGLRISSLPEVENAFLWDTLMVKRGGTFII